MNDRIDLAGSVLTLCCIRVRKNLGSMSEMLSEGGPTVPTRLQQHKHHDQENVIHPIQHICDITSVPGRLFRLLHL